jgi:hypothetical protein
MLDTSASFADTNPMRRIRSLLFLVLLGMGLMTVLARKSVSSEQQSSRISQALVDLSRIPTGEALIQKALHVWNLETAADLLVKFKSGDASRTDTVLTRHYNPKTGLEERDREVIIYLRENQSRLELALDMAHEMVHATARPAFDPYDPSLTPGKYIWSALEGEGGEVDAVLLECKAGLELAKQFNEPLKRCRNYLSQSSGIESKELDRERVRKDFYQVGKWHKTLSQQLKRELAFFPLLSTETPKLYSSTGHAPYPAALMNEFMEINETACKNSQKRLKSLTLSDASASKETPEESQFIRKNAENFIQKRCR